MRRHLFYGRYGTRDNGTVTAPGDHTPTAIALLDTNGNLDHGLGRALRNLARFGVHPSSVGVDLMVLALHVHAADTRLSRRRESQDSWTREIRLVVPVSDPSRWTAAASTLTRALNFLTGDLWTVAFRQSPPQAHAASGPSATPLMAAPYDELSLFSGGLDSLIGAIDTLTAGRTPLLIGHAGDGATSESQRTCHRVLREHFADSQFGWLRLWMTLPKIKVEGSSREKTTRGRSFLFFATAAMAASGLNAPVKIRIPENGFISLNVALDPLRLGAHSTRTTHPFYVARWNELLEQIGIPATLHNPYWDQTKGEMAAGCSDPGLLQHLVSSSLSCASPAKGRWRGTSIRHCGYCLPCLVRRAALAYAPSIEDTTEYAIADLTARPMVSTAAEGQQIRSLQYALAKLAERPRRAALAIHAHGSLADVPSADREALADVYRRGMSELGKLLEDVQTRAE
jgi:7-cyano-7-deazaguanine synthase in queuosine biosynthesis